ncbi:PTS transporter subunit EIIC [Mycoplasma sp. ATU-Cv-508]|uniref:PTS transporter subunit EIIC n=1 Tax=Mycoplasma sp. ATU-Cv-508 TaxID=2048001 RepID=UPI001EFFEA10
MLFEAGGRDAASLKNLVGSNLGIRSLNTSVFGGIIVGAIVAFLYNRFQHYSTAQVISFFGGKRFVSLLVIVANDSLAFIFLLFYRGW